MKIPIPSFRIQIVLLVLFLVTNSALFFRYYFLDSFQTYASTTDSLKISTKINKLYEGYYNSIMEENKVGFKKEIEALLATQKQTKFARNYFKEELAISSLFIFFFLTISVLILFIFSFNLISTPIKKLKKATERLQCGDWDIQIKESPFSPLNHLIISFNEMTAELEANREKLINAEKESVWRGMAKIMAHEIKNPLTPIKLSLERMEAKFYSSTEPFNPIFKKTTSIIHEEINNLHLLAKAFSEFAKLPDTHFENMNVNENLKEILIPYINTNQITSHFSSLNPTIQVDKIQFKQIIVNLIQNAIHASKKEEKIEIITELNPLSDITIVRIRDFGKGISEDNLSYIFDPYFTDKEKGTGLGLAIVKRMMIQHDGEIKVESQLGLGTTFSLFFKGSSHHKQ